MSTFRPGNRVRVRDISDEVRWGRLVEGQEGVVREITVLGYDVLFDGKADTLWMISEELELVQPGATSVQIPPTAALTTPPLSIDPKHLVHLKAMREDLLGSREAIRESNNFVAGRTDFLGFEERQTKSIDALDAVLALLDPENRAENTPPSTKPKTRILMVDD